MTCLIGMDEFVELALPREEKHIEICDRLIDSNK